MCPSSASAGAATSDLLYPWFYTFHEGGDWIRWLWRPFTLAELELTALEIVERADGTRAAMIRLNVATTVAVHALAFEDPASGEDRHARWDCVNGWTTTIGQARAAHPQGKHGECPPWNEEAGGG